MRVFRLVLTVALAAAVFAQDAPAAESTTDLAVQGNLDGAVTSEVTPEILQTGVAPVDPAVDPEKVEEIKAGAVETIDTIEDAMAESEIAKDIPQIDPALADAAAGILKRAADSELAKQNDASGVLNNVAGQIDPTSGTTTSSTIPKTGSTATTTSATPGIDMLQNAAAGSDISGLQSASQLLGLAQNTGLFPDKAISQFKTANPELNTMLGALTNGAGIGLAMNKCYGSIEGDEAAIQSSLTSLGTSMVNSDSITAAAGVGQAVIMASPDATSGQKEAMYQLFRIYLDQNANTGKALSATQEKAYASLTPECNAAFDDIVTTYQDSKGTVSSIMAGGKNNVTCANFQDNSTFVDMTLCVWPSAIWTDKEKIMANITATFTNYGVGLCDVSFYIINLAENVGLKPSWLPNANKAFPDGIPKGAEVAIEASVPWTNEIAENKPVVDILKGWSACPNGRATAAPTAARTEKPKTETGVINVASQCFVTDACKTAVAPFANDQCGAYTQLLTSGCSTCSQEILMSAARSCIATCPANACGGLVDKEETTSGAGVLSKAVAFVVTLVAAFAFAL